MRKASAVVATILASLALPGVARAADQSVTFSELGLPEFTTVLDQYAGSPYLVRFGSADSFGFPAPPPLLNCGSPYTQSNALTGTALQISCRTGSNEFPDRRFATAMEFQNEQRRIRFKLKNNTGRTQTAITRFYAIGSNAPLTTLTTVLVAGATANLDYDRGSNGIIGAVVQGSEAMDYSDSGGVFVDDLIMSRDAQALSPKFTLALQQPSAEVIEGSTVEVPVSVRRYNGSSGAVTISVGTPLPSRIQSTEFSPNASVTGSNPATLRIRAKLPFSGTQQLSVSAASGGSAGTGVNVTNLQQSVTGIPATYFLTGGRFPLRLVPGCGPQKIDDSFAIRGGGLDGYTSYNFDGSTSTSGLASMTTGSAIYPTGDGQYPIEYNLDPGANDGSGSFRVKVSHYAGTPATITLNWLTDRLAMRKVSDNGSVALPLREGGNTIHVYGNFPANCPVKIVDKLNQEWSVRLRDRTEIDGVSMDDLTLNMPASAVSGPLRALNSAGTEMARTQDIDVREYRRQYGSRQANSGPGAKGTYSWDDFEATFGDDDTDACFIVCVHDPVAADYYDDFKTSVESGTGLCYGWATMANRFRGYSTGQTPSNYEAGATRAWDIMGTGDGTEYKRQVVRWFVTQWDKSTYDAYEKGKSQSPAAERTLLKDLLAQQGSALIAIRQGGNGHAITAYGIRDTGDGGMLVSVYDPNIPYSTDEEAKTETRNNALSESTLTINANGSWDYPGLDWKGDNSTLTVAPNIPPLDAKLRSDFSLATVFASSGGPSEANITGIESGGKPQLDSDGEPTADSSVGLSPALSGAGAAPKYVLRKGREYELTIKGSGKGSYDSSLLTGDATASVRSADTKAGQIDRVTIRPGESSVQFASGASSSGVVYDLKRRTGKVVRTAAITTTAREGASDEAELSGGTVRIAHEGAPTKVALTLGSVGAGLPTNGQTPAMTIGRDQKLDITPSSWSSLTGGVRYTLRAKSGRVIRRGNVAMRGTTKLGLGKVSAKRKGKTLTVTGAVTKRGSAPALAAVATIKKGGKVVRRKTATLSGAKVKKGKFSLRVALGSVPKGAKVTVDVVLADPTGGGASVKKKASVR